jgi:hypothetical protein
MWASMKRCSNKIVDFYVSLHMRSVSFISALIGAIAFALAVFCALQFFITKFPTSESLATISGLANPSRMNAQDARQFERAANSIRWNDEQLLRSYLHLWLAGTVGFFGVGAANTVLAVVAYRSAKGGGGAG